MTATHAALTMVCALLFLHLVGCALSRRSRRPASAPGRPLPFEGAAEQLAFAAPPDDRSPVDCAHPPPAWTTADGVGSCTRCGTRRILDYRPPGLALELPERTALHGPTLTCAGALEGNAHRRHADLRAKVREANHRSSRAKP
ncbi:DUF6255 family natural product biosynthesis protein [Streptomyces sp. NPDC026206]|uniref:DUF6255 family natural product biosynthesis protein n=1 Tax=Streptomyces sp. NPDC026206 TaxID=3157089 RepID=UPI0033C0F80F